MVLEKWFLINQLCLTLVSQYILSLNLSHPEYVVNEFFAGRSQREQQVTVVMERGYNNMKSDKVKAAIADFTRAIRVWYVMWLCYNEPLLADQPHIPLSVLNL